MFRKTVGLKNFRSFDAGEVMLQKDLTAFVGKNRIAHHEPIFDRHLVADYASLLQVAGWISAETRAWTEHHSRLPAVLAQSPDDAGLLF